MTRRINPIKRAKRRVRQLWRRIGRMKSLTKVLLFVALPLAISALAFFYSSPEFLSERRSLLEQGKGAAAILFSEGSILLVHLVIYLGATVGLWLFYHFHEKKAFQIYSILLVVVVLCWSTWNLAKAGRFLASQQAKEMCSDTVRNANDQLSRTTRLTSRVIILDQAIARIISYFHIIVRSEFPEFKLRTVSLHLLPANAHKDQVWNVIQEGAQAKDADVLSYQSLVGTTISERKRKYCPDVTHPAEFGADCTTFQPIIGADPGYKSLVCFPVKGAASSTEAYAGLCFDSMVDRAFDNQLDELELVTKKQVEELAPLLRQYRDEDRFFFKEIETPASLPK